MRPEQRAIRVIDTHYGGDVSRIVVGGVAALPGRSVREMRDYLARDADGLRRLLLYPPYGAPAMCVDLVVPAADPRARFGYIVMETMGYPHFSGSNTICTVTALLESGMVEMQEGEQSVLLEAPFGLVEATARCEGGAVRSVSVDGGGAYVAGTDLAVEVPGRGEVRFDLVWSGCFYAVVEAAAHGFSLAREETAELTAFAAALCEAAAGELPLVHPEVGDTGPLSFVCLAGPMELGEGGARRTRSATYVHPGVLCSCPTGTGTSARLACLRQIGAIEIGETIETISPSGSTMSGTLLAEAEVSGQPGIRTAIAGRAFVMAESRIVVDVDDPLVDAGELWGLLEPLAGAPISSRPPA